MTEAAYLVGQPVTLPEDVDCQRCHRPSRALALVWKIKSLRDDPLDEDGRRYYCPACVTWLGPRARLIPPPEVMEAQARTPLPPLPTGVEQWGRSSILQTGAGWPASSQNGHSWEPRVGSILEPVEDAASPWKHGSGVNPTIESRWCS